MQRRKRLAVRFRFSSWPRAPLLQFRPLFVESATINEHKYVKDKAGGVLGMNENTTAARIHNTQHHGHKLEGTVHMYLVRPFLPDA